jgi:glycosyltransferase involved in cell wall biosynthesis
MRRILFVIGSLEVGGAERHLVAVACALKARGWSPEVFVFTRGGPLSTQLDDAGIAIHGPTLPAWIGRALGGKLQARLTLVFSFVSLIRVMLARKPVLVHFYLPAAYILGGLAALVSATRPRIMSRRSLNFYQQKHPIFGRLERFLHPRMDRICGNSKAVVRQLEGEGGRPDQVRLIYNGVDFSPFHEQFDRRQIRRSLGIGETVLLIVMVANLIPYKGHADLLRAMAHIADRMPLPWCLLCVGRDDGIGDSLRELVAELNLASRVVLTGSRSDIPAILASADIGVLCSHEEGFSNSVLECMAAGLPMAVTDVGGNAEAVLDGVTGYVVPPRDSAALGKAILALASDPDRREMGRRGRQRAEELFSMPACVASYETLYEELLRDSIQPGKR